MKRNNECVSIELEAPPPPPPPPPPPTHAAGRAYVPVTRWALGRRNVEIKKDVPALIQRGGLKIFLELAFSMCRLPGSESGESLFMDSSYLFRVWKTLSLSLVNRSTLI